MTNTVYIIDIEPVETRYTGEWKEHLPKQLKKFLGKGAKVKTISGGTVPDTVTEGAFLNFAGTNTYKCQQMVKIAKLFAEGEVNDGDYFLYTDAWNPTVIQLRYMAELLGINIKIGGMWHAGSYDPQDFLGRIIGGKPWVRYAEASMFECYNHNFFASMWHVKLFADVFLEGEQLKVAFASDQVKVVGWPMEYLKNNLGTYNLTDKENIVVFPHRIAPEKQPEIAKAIAEKLDEIDVIFCQEKKMSKKEYHETLTKAKVVFSANLQETLGISGYEGALLGAIPVVPDRLSYMEMYPTEYKYPSEYSISQDTANIDELVGIIKDTVENYDEYHKDLTNLTERLSNFFDGKKLYSIIAKTLRSNA